MFVCVCMCVTVCVHVYVHACVHVCVCACVLDCLKSLFKIHQTRIQKNHARMSLISYPITNIFFNFWVWWWDVKTLSKT